MFSARPAKKQGEAAQSSETPFFAGYSEEDALKALRSSRAGLSESEAKKRLKQYGLNVMNQRNRFTLFRRVIAQLRNPIVAILLLSGVLLYIIGSLVDAYLIFAILLLNLVISVVQEGKVSRAFNLLRESDQLFALVFRDGREIEVPAQDLVPGDIVVFKIGARVPADIRVLQEDSLQTNESSLTGEWAPVDKRAVTLVNDKPLAEQVNMVWKGTTIVSGSGIGVVTATGKHTIFGTIAEQLYEGESKTPLQRQVQDLAKWIMMLILLSALGVVGIALLRGIPLVEAVLMAIAIAIAGVPSGLPAAITVVLVFGMRSVLKNHGLVRNLLAAETLGSTTRILTDKTGTLTRGDMTLSEIVFAHSREPVSDASITPFSRGVIFDAYLATDGRRSHKQGDDASVLSGSAVEQALVRACESVCTSSPNRERQAAYIPFSPDTRYSAALIQDQGGAYRYCVVGAPESIIDQAESAYSEGKIVPLVGKKRMRLRALLAEEAAKGRRVIGVGIKQCPDNALEHATKDSAKQFLQQLDHDADTPLIFMALLVLEDSVRADVPDAIARIRQAHITTTMVTGDNRDTALFIAKRSGIVTPGDSEEVLLGDDIRNLTDDELFTKAQRVRVFARMLPEQKSRLLSTLLERGEIVAMTGDGVNDAPALHRASIGIAVASGTDVAKESSDLILLKNSFTTVMESVMEGRRILRNLKKILIYLLSTSFSEAALVAGGLLITAGLPVTPVQVLWANIVEEAFIAFAYAFEKEESDVSKLNPRNQQTGSIISGNVRKAIIILACTTGFFLLGVYFFFSYYTDLSQPQIQTVMFLAVSVDSIFLAIALKQLNASIFTVNPFTNWWLVGAIVLSVGVIILAFVTPQLSALLSLSSIPLWAFWVIPASALYHVTVIESV